MNRPRLNPLFMEDAKPAPQKVPKWIKVLRLIGRGARVLTTDIFGRGRKQGDLKDEVGSPIARIIRGFLYRLMFLPTLLAILVAVLVVTATHPTTAPGVLDPMSQGVHYETVDLVSSDNTKLDGWLVPVVDAKRIITEKEEVLNRRYAAVVLVHDFGMSRQQLLPLVVPLHDAGYVTLSINLRGRGPSTGVGSTFGLNEAQDVRAAVDLLRRRRYVDPDSISVLGVGTGATAALLAAREDPRLGVLVLDHPTRDFEELLSDRIGPKQDWLSWTKPMCKWAFEIAYKVDAEEVNLSRFLDILKSRKVLVMDDNTETVSCTKPTRTKQVVDFYRKNLTPRRALTRGNILIKDRVGSVPDNTGNTRQPIPMDDEPQWPPQRRASDLLDKAW
jgi:pimeloyl-ACP methyl ester carboxylesterase